MGATTIDPTALDALVERAVNDLSAGYDGVMISLGHTLGLYKAMAGAGPLSSAELAARTGCAERYVREWLNAQVAGGYAGYRAASDTYELSPAQAAVLADEESTVFMPSAWDIPAALWASETRAAEAFRTGRGVAWGEHEDRLHCGVAAVYRNGYRASLVSEWLPALDGVVARLEAGTPVADVGCGHGHSTVLMAEAFPRSRFVGFDTHAPSVAEARRLAEQAGLGRRALFSVAGATEYPEDGYGLICFFDCLHDFGDPVAAARHAAGALAPGGTVLLVEPFAADHVDEAVSPVARLYYAGSTLMCCPHAISEGGRLVLGAQAGEARLAEVFREAGFTHFRRAAETPLNLIFEARLR